MLLLLFYLNINIFIYIYICNNDNKEPRGEQKTILPNYGRRVKNVFSLQ